jgi:hypothetical protein
MGANSTRGVSAMMTAIVNFSDLVPSAAQVRDTPVADIMDASTASVSASHQLSLLKQ